MLFDNIYKNTVTFTTNNSVEFRFTDNASEMRYLLDIIIDNNIVINNVLSIGSFKNVGSIINNSASTIGINLDSSKITLVLSGTHIVDMKIKHGIFIGSNDSVSTPVLYHVIPVGYSFSLVKGIMNETDKLNYTDNILSPVEDSVLATVNSLLSVSEEKEVADLYSTYEHDNATYPKLAYIGKLNSTNITTYIEPASLDNSLFINNSIVKSKLNGDVTVSLGRADTSVQNIYINDNQEPEIKTNGVVNLNLSTAIKFLKETEGYYTYSNVAGIATIMDNSSDIQPKILNTKTDGKTYFISYLDGGGYDFEDMSNFFKKEYVIKDDEPISGTSLYSSLKTKSLLEGKVNKLQQELTPIENKLIKIKINEQGLIYEQPIDVLSSDLTNTGMIGNYYQKTGVKKVINTSRSTIFFM
jgi:hypothetical protein